MDQCLCHRSKDVVKTTDPENVAKMTSPKTTQITSWVLLNMSPVSDKEHNLVSKKGKHDGLQHSFAKNKKASMQSKATLRTKTMPGKKTLKGLAPLTNLDSGVGKTLRNNKNSVALCWRCRVRRASRNNIITSIHHVYSAQSSLTFRFITLIRHSLT